MVFMPMVGAFCVLLDSGDWNDLRFRFNPQNGELFFGKAKATYRREDYSKLIFGCVRGYNKEDAHKEWGLLLLTQIFVLVLDKNDGWQRYTLSDDTVVWKTHESGSKQFIKIVECLQPFLTFDQFIKEYSLDECSEQQDGKCV